MNVDVLGATGERTGEVALDDTIFGVKVNVPLMHQVVVAQIAAGRSGCHSTKTRGEVRGGGAKPWRQKGTGRARHGSVREPQWKGGGTTFGPKPRDHSVGVPKKMKALALRSALSVRAAEAKLLVVDGLEFDKPKTKQAVAALNAWKIEGKVLLVLTRDEVNAAYSFRNLPQVHVIEESQLNVYDVMNADNLIYTRKCLDAFQTRISGGVRGVAAPSPDSPPADQTTDSEPGEARETPRSTGEAGEGS
jgi:large subunit ribosomal protein L4